MAGPADDPFGDLFSGQAQPAAPSPTQAQTGNVADDPFDDIFNPRQSKAEGYLRQAAQGLTFGFSDEIEAAARTGSLFAGDAYKAKRDRIRKMNEDFRRQNPVSSFVAEMAGSLPTVFFPGFGAARLGQAIASGSARQVAHQSGMMGSKMGAAYGAGSAKEVGDIPGDAATHAAFGYGFGAPLGVATHGLAKGIGRMVEHGNSVMREGSDAAANALNEINRALKRDGTSPQALYADLMPSYGAGRHAMDPATLETILVRYGEGLAKGGDDQAVRQAIVADMVSMGAKKATAERQVREITRRWNERHEIPLQLHELPALREGSTGYASNMAMRVAMNRPNDRADTFRAAIVSRQEGIGEQMSDLVARALGGRNADDVLERARVAHAARMRDQYATAIAADEAALRIAQGVPHPPGALVPTGAQPLQILNPLVDAMATRHTRGGEVKAGLGKAIDLFFDKPEVGQQALTLRRFLDAKMELDQMIQTSMKDHRPTPLTRELTIFKQNLMDQVSRQNPYYAKANADAAKGFSEIKAGEMARQLGLGLNHKSRQVLRQFRTMTDDQKDMVRVMLAQNIAEKIANQGKTHSVAKLFDKEAGQKILRTVLGEAETEAIMEQVKRARIATKTFGNMGGSQTAPLGEAMRQSDLSQRFRDMLQYLSPAGAMKGLAEIATTKAMAKRDAEMLRMMGVSTENPAEMIGAIKRLIAQSERPPPPLLARAVTEPSAWATPGAVVWASRQDY